MSPNEPLPIFLPSRYLLPTLSSMLISFKQKNTRLVKRKGTKFYCYKVIASVKTNNSKQKTDVSWSISKYISRLQLWYCRINKQRSFIYVILAVGNDHMHRMYKDSVDFLTTIYVPPLFTDLQPLFTIVRRRNDLLPVWNTRMT